MSHRVESAIGIIIALSKTAFILVIPACPESVATTIYMPILDAPGLFGIAGMTKIEIPEMLKYQLYATIY